jgi:hypothetical protein
MRDAAAERQPGDPGLGHDPAGGGEAERCRDAVDVSPRRAALHVHGSAGRVDVDRAHRREIDDDAVVGDRRARGVVPAAPNGERQVVLGSEADGRRDVVGVHGARDRDRALVDHAVPDAPGRVVVAVVGPDHLAAEPIGERCSGTGRD